MLQSLAAALRQRQRAIPWWGKHCSSYASGWSWWNFIRLRSLRRARWLLAFVCMSFAKYIVQKFKFFEYFVVPTVKLLVKTKDMDVRNPFLLLSHDIQRLFKSHRGVCSSACCICLILSKSVSMFPGFRFSGWCGGSSARSHASGGTEV